MHNFEVQSGHWTRPLSWQSVTSLKFCCRPTSNLAKVQWPELSDDIIIGCSVLLKQAVKTTRPDLGYP